jgi:hypothetical protein
MVSYNQKIKYIERRIGQKNLSEALGLNDRTIRRYKEGTRRPSYINKNNIDLIYNKTKEIIKRPAKGRIQKSKNLNKLKPSLGVAVTPKLKPKIRIEKFKEAQTEHLIISISDISSIDSAVDYLIKQKCEAAYLVIRCKKDGSKKVLTYQTPIWEINDFKGSYLSDLAGITGKYKINIFNNLGEIDIDVIGVRYAEAS